MNDTAHTLPSEADALALAERPFSSALMLEAAELRDQGFGNVITYSRKVFLPLTELCRDVCHYCTFAKTPKRVDAPYMAADKVVALARAGAQLGCKEALFTLGERPELRYPAARRALDEMGFESTLHYVAHVANRVLQETGLLPHINAGTMDADEFEMLRPVSASMGIMLESSSERLCGRGMPHFGSPDKQPSVRLETIRAAGSARVPFTSGILIGIGETRLERVESLLALRELHCRYGHLQEIIIQNFRAKPGTLMANAAEPSLDELLWTIAVARIIFGPEMSIQAPPNLSPDRLSQLVDAGINDWGGISPLTPDHVNPEAPWPHLERLAEDTAHAGKVLDERLTIYPPFVLAQEAWLDEGLRKAVLRHADGQGFARSDDWVSGTDTRPPRRELALLDSRDPASCVSPDIARIVSMALDGEALALQDCARLFEARGPDFRHVCQAADQLRQQRCGDRVSFTVNRNINYTNICTLKCGFCAFSKGKAHEDLRGRPYNLDYTDIADRVMDARRRGATEVCMQGGIHPSYTGQTYLDILATVKGVDPKMHVHAFSPLEVTHGAETLGISTRTFLRQARHAGLDTMPGTAAEVLDERVRRQLCPDKLSVEQWLNVIEQAHEEGIRTTATIMFGHVDDYLSWARHLLAIRALQSRTHGFTEFVPLPFVAREAPIYRRRGARMGPTFREAVLMHAIARLVFNGLIDNIQASWVKLGASGVEACLHAGVNDLGGTLMEESITRAAGAVNGQEFTRDQFQQLIGRHQRRAWQRNTLYQPVASEAAVIARAS